uniref:Pleckstrin homology domain containing N1 n=1 Tax=Calidris pygmaea TaxID=425635 RepID=A0A8C3KDV0_9CHAR
MLSGRQRKGLSRPEPRLALHREPSSPLLPKEQHDRLLVLYPSTLVIVSEEHNTLCFKGELPLNAIQVLFEENEKTSFLIEGRLINSIRVICRSYDDYQEWLYCLKTAQFRNADSSLSGSESFSGSKLPHPGQFAGSGRGSLTSDGRTNSWASGGRVATLTHLSQNSGSLPDGQSFVLMPESRALEDSFSSGYSQPLHSLAHPNWPSTGLPPQDLRRGGSARKSKGKCGQQLPSQDTERTICSLIPENPNGELLSSVYHEPYPAHGSQHHPAAPPSHLDLSNVRGLGRGGMPSCPGRVHQQRNWCTIHVFLTPACRNSCPGRCVTRFHLKTAHGK